MLAVEVVVPRVRLPPARNVSTPGAPVTPAAHPVSQPRIIGKNLGFKASEVDDVFAERGVEGHVAGVRCGDLVDRTGAEIPVGGEDDVAGGF